MRRMLLPVLLLLLLEGCRDPYGLQINWGVTLPDGEALVYEADSGPSFHGDGVRYHVLRYGKTEELEKCLPWLEPSADAAKWADGQLDEIDVPAEERTDFASCRYWTERQEDHSVICIFYEEDSGTLHVVECCM